MLAASNCWNRNCKHYIGVSQPDGTEMSERHVCKAFPEQIPEKINSGKELHSKPLAGQKNDIVYEKE